MSEDSKKIIIAHKYLEILRKHSRFLARGSLTVYPIGSNSEALMLQKKVRADLIVTGFDVPGISGEDLCSHIREDEELRNVSIIIVCSKEPGEAERLSNCRANAFLSVDTAPQAFAEAARKLLNISQRVGIRVPVSVRVEGKDRHGRPFLGFSENLSATGMLMESEKKLETGTMVTCSFFLEDNTQIITKAQVVRSNLRTPGHGSNEYGLMFTGLTGGIMEAIATYVRNRMKPGTPD